MNFNNMTKTAKIRSIVFLAVSALVALIGVNMVEVCRDAQIELSIKDPSGKVIVDGADFTLFFVSGVGILNGFMTLVILVACIGAMLLIGLVAALLLRFIALRKSWTVDDGEYKFCVWGFRLIAAAGFVIALIVTKLGMVLSIAAMVLLPLLFIRLIYLTALKKRSVTGAQGHFVQGTQQDFTQL